MSIHISEPGRPQGTRLSETLRSRRIIGGIDQSSETAALKESSQEATDAGLQQAREVTARRAVAQYGHTSEAEPEPERAYLPVGNICSSWIHSLPASTLLTTSLDEMERRSLNHLVITSGDEVAGLVSIRWIQGWLLEHRAEAQTATFQQIELPAFLTASPETDAHQLARLMLAHQLDCALVIDTSRQPVGVVTSTDYLRLYASLGHQAGKV